MHTAQHVIETARAAPGHDGHTGLLHTAYLAVAFEQPDPPGEGLERVVAGLLRVVLQTRRKRVDHHHGEPAGTPVDGALQRRRDEQR